MTELLFQDDSYLKEFQANITEMVEGGAVLDRSAFYIGGGGQPCDTGLLIQDGHEHIVTSNSSAGCNSFGRRSNRNRQD